MKGIVHPIGYVCGGSYDAGQMSDQFLAQTAPRLRLDVGIDRLVTDLMGCGSFVRQSRAEAATV